MSLKIKLREKSKGYWNFSDFKSSGIHRICSYPATMVPDMQRELIEMVLEEDSSINNIFDPFHGSGVTLVEGAGLGLIPIGFDINPLASLMTRVKLQGINKDLISSSNKKIIKILMSEDVEFPIHNFSNIDKWFRTDIIESLSKVKYAIEQEKSKNIRQFYWVCMINIIKKYSNTRSSTFKLHIKKENDILLVKNDVINDFCKSIKKSVDYLPDYTRQRKIFLSVGDTTELLDKVEKNSIDLICTSPPYGDNGTTVTYGQYSILPLFWINNKDLTKFDESLLDNYSSIDSASLGGIKNNKDGKRIESIELDNYLNLISKDKHKKVKKFINDYLLAFDGLAEVLKPNKYMIITLGNRRVDNQVLPLTDITIAFLTSKNLQLVDKIERDIPIKRMPRKVSRVNNKSVDSMNSEYILIFKKIKD